MNPPQPRGISLLNGFMFKHVFNGETLVKTVTIRNEVYEMLASMKRRDESFSDLIERLVKKSQPHRNPNKTKRMHRIQKQRTNATGNRKEKG